MNLHNKLNFSWRKKLPVIQQTQAAECGLTCVAMIANYYGHKIDMITLRRRFSTSLKGATLGDVMLVSHQLGLAGRALRLEIDELHKLRTPCILHWDMNHFVVLKAVTKKKIIIHDPARGRRELALDEVSSSFTGVALELLPSAKFEKNRRKNRCR